MNLRKLLALGLGGAAALLGAFLILGLVFPGQWSAERSVLIAAPPETVYPLIEDLAAWDGWTPWGDVESTFEGTPRGPGARRVWDDPELGDGWMEITAAEPLRSVSYAVVVEGGNLTFDGELTLEPEDEGTRVRWVERGDFGRNPLLGWVARNMDATQGQQLEMSLERLRDVVAERAANPS